MKRKFFLVVYLFFLGVTLYAQSTDYDVQTEGQWLPVNKSDAAFQAYRIRVKLLSRPVNEGKGGILSLHATYDYIGINFKRKQELFNDLESFHSAGFMLGYIKQLRNPKWSFTGMVIPQLNSNFAGGVSGDDFYLNVVAMLNYSRQKGSRLSFGFAYTSTLGVPAPIPVINYRKSWGDKWEMNLGFPRVNLTHHFNTMNSLVALIEVKGYNGNISKAINSSVFEESRSAQRISYRNILSGLEWQCNLKSLQFKINASYTLNREFKLQDRDNDTAYKFDMSNCFNVGAGIAFNF